MQVGKVTSFVAVYWEDLSVELRPVGPLPAWPSARASGSYRGTASVKDKRKKSIALRTAIAWQDVPADDLSANLKRKGPARKLFSVAGRQEPARHR
jgi:hypothetical protein